MDAVGTIISGLIGGLMFALFAWLISKITGRKSKKEYSKLTQGFTNEKLSVEEITSICFLLIKIAEFDEKISDKEISIIQNTMNVLDYNPKDKETKRIGTEFENYSIELLADELHNISSSLKEWFTRVAYVLLTCDDSYTDKDMDCVKSICLQIGVMENRHNNIKREVMSA